MVGRGRMRYSYALCHRLIRRITESTRKYSSNDIIIYIYSTKKLRKSQKTMIQNTKTNNYSILIYLFRYISLDEKMFTLVFWQYYPCCGTVSSNLGVKVIFRKKRCPQSCPSFDAKTHEKAVSFQNLKWNSFELHMK